MNAIVLKSKSLTAFVAVSAAILCGSARAEENAGEKAAELEEKEDKIFEAGLDLDFNSAYVDKNAVMNERMVIQPCVWADLTMLDPFTFGFYIWQNWDVTGNRRYQDGDFKHALNETDYNVHAGLTCWQSEDEESDLSLEIGHDWFTYHGRRAPHGEYPDTREIYAKLTFANPIVDVYGRTCWMYEDFGNDEDGYKQGLYYELGFTKEIEITDDLTFGADWNVGFGDARYLCYLYGDCCDNEEDDVWSHPDGGFGGTTLKFYLDYAVTEWFTLGARIAYTGVLSKDARSALKDNDCARECRDILWGGISAKFSF